MKARDFLHALESSRHSRYFSVPDSTLEPCLRLVDFLTTCSNEGEAVAMAVGAQIDGRRSCVFIQNSGLGNALNPLTSLVIPFGIGLTLVVGYRGQPGLRDEPQHLVMGAVTRSLLDQIGFVTRVVDDAETIDDLEVFLNDESTPFKALLISRGAFGSDAGGGVSRTHSSIPERNGQIPRSMAIQQIAEAVSDEAWIVSSTGKISRELESLADRERNFYMVGSMGCASSIGVGIASAGGDSEPVLILDGDGAAMMRMESLALVGTVKEQVVDHVVLDNGVHESTGGQWSTSRLVDLSSIARACGYVAAYDLWDVNELIRLLGRPGRQGSHFYRLYVSVEDTQDLPRPSLTPEQNWLRMKRQRANFVDWKSNEQKVVG